VKKSTSEAMNKTIPIFSPFFVCWVCAPCVEVSRFTSRHQQADRMRAAMVERSIIFWLPLLIEIRAEAKRDIPPMELKIGQGLFSTK
jgi:hypothetical protein